MESFIARTEKVKDGSVIIEEGSWAYYAYVLQSGKAKVWKNINGKQVQIGTLKEGDIFGEMSFFGMAKRTATVTAEGEVKVGMITKDTFVEALDKLPAEARARIEKMSHDLFYLNDVYCRLTNCFHEIMTIKGKMVDPKVFEKEVADMPEFLRNVVTLMSKRFHCAIEDISKMFTHLENASRAIDSLSTSLIKKT
ncbi:MAG TPA: cyclic nucleotide-binding domain-containing protein [Candidatus Brocadiaceae bacterium]|nr:cyclic nucleotide-binding domain-containing protein [Candidatus Brocadiaceae bacterium]